MAQQPLFFEKNKLDLSKESVTVTASQCNDYTAYMRNRSNNTAWITTGSVDADNTNIVVDFVDSVNITDIILIKHNFKAYTIQYWDGAAYQDFSTAIAETTNSAATTHHNFTQQSTTKIKLIITGTTVADSEKYLYQFIATDRIGQFSSWAILKPVISRTRQVSKMLSGKKSIRERAGAYACDLQVKLTSNDSDLTIVENLHDSNNGFLFWACGGDESQFRNERQGYRLEDIYLCKCKNEYKPLWYKGGYQTGMKIDLKLEEVVA